jgi:hypothetical protein
MGCWRSATSRDLLAIPDAAVVISGSVSISVQLNSTVTKYLEVPPNFPSVVLKPLLLNRYS